MEKAALMLRDGIPQPQMWRGKAFPRDPFVASPAVCKFKDTRPGVPQQLKVRLTNASYGRCTFKLLPMPEDAASLFTIKHEPPGQISSGMSSTLLITYCPQADADIDTTIPLLTSTGPMHVPVQCRRRIASLSVSESRVHLEAVMLGASKTETLQVTNTGGLQVRNQHSSQAMHHACACDGVMVRPGSVAQSSPTLAGELQDCHHVHFLASAIVVQR
jgi:hypothetical protein